MRRSKWNAKGGSIHIASKPKINITSKVWRRMRRAITLLEDTIKKNNPLAHITKIIVDDCSLTRGLMVKGSDIDKMYIGVEGVDKQEFGLLTANFSKWIKVEGLNLKGFSALPQIIDHNRLEDKIKQALAQGKHTAVVYEAGRFRSPQELLKESIFSFAIHMDKFIARIKLLLLMGEISLGHARVLLNKIDKDRHFGFYKELESAILDYENLKLTEEARQLAILLTDIAGGPVRVLDVPKEREREYEDVLYELCSKNLVRIFGAKIIPVWIVNNPGWSDKFWDEQIVLKEENIDSFSFPRIISNIQRKLKADKEIDDSDRLGLVFEEKGAAVMTDLFKAQAIEALSHHSIFVSAMAAEVIGQRIDDFADKLLEHLDSLLKRSDIKKIYGESAIVSHYILRLLFLVVVRDPTKAGRICEFIYQYILNQDVSELLVYKAMEGLWKILPSIKDDVWFFRIYCGYRLALNLGYMKSFKERVVFAGG